VKRAALLCSLSGVLWAAPALAQAPPPAAMRLEYTRAPGAVRCPADQELRDAITSRVRGRDFLDAAAAARLVVTARGQGGRYLGTAELRDASGATAWSLSVGPVAQDCAAVMDAVALSIAIKLGAQRASAPPAAAHPAGNRLFGVDGEALPVPPAPLAGAPATPDGVTPPASPVPTPRRVRVGGGAAFEMAAAPGFALGLFADVGIRWPSFSLAAAEVRAVLLAGADVEAGAHVTSRYTAAVVPCGHWLRFLVVCGLVEAGAVRGTGNAMHPLTPLTAVVPYLGAGP
jgi:hypothetical protein